jgi:hypothetical protein
MDKIAPSKSGIKQVEPNLKDFNFAHSVFSRNFFLSILAGNLGAESNMGSFVAHFRQRRKLNTSDHQRLSDLATQATGPVAYTTSQNATRNTNHGKTFSHLT